MDEDYPGDVTEIRDWLRPRLVDGVHCPACGQYAKVYRRKINANMAHKLIGAWRRHGREWFYLPNLLSALRVSGRDESFLRHWGLIEEADEVREDGGRAGWWCVTERGEQFVNNKITVPRYARIYDGRLLGLTGDPVGIRDALGDRFDYRELMEGT